MNNNNINQHTNSQTSKDSFISEKNTPNKYTYLLENNKNRSFTHGNNIPNNIIYQKPQIKSKDYFNNNMNTYEDSKNDSQYYDTNENCQYENNINNNNFDPNKIREIQNNLKENEIKMERVNKTMINFINNKKDEVNNSRSWVSEMYEIEKMKQENLILKADSIIYAEDITHLSEVNKNLSQELEATKRKIYDLISKGDEAIQILNNKNYEINQLTESISNLKLSNCPEVLDNIKSNRTKDQLIFELQFKLTNLNNDKIKVETEKKILEEQYNNLLEEKKAVVKQDEMYKNKISSNINNLEEKIKKMEKLVDELSIKNNELKMNNKKWNENIEMLSNEKNYFENKYMEKKEQCNELENEFKNLENKYSQLLYDTQKQKFIKEKIRSEEEKKNKRKRKISSKKIIVNDLFNQIQNLKEKIKTERKMYE
jgi:hypothetical protein